MELMVNGHSASSFTGVPELPRAVTDDHGQSGSVRHIGTRVLKAVLERQQWSCRAAIVRLRSRGGGGQSVVVAQQQ